MPYVTCCVGQLRPFFTYVIGLVVPLVMQLVRSKKYRYGFDGLEKEKQVETMKQNCNKIQSNTSKWHNNYLSVKMPLGYKSINMVATENEKRNFLAFP